MARETDYERKLVRFRHEHDGRSAEGKREWEVFMSPAQHSEENLMAHFDLTMRYLAKVFPKDMASFALGHQVKSVEILSSDLPATERTADWLARVDTGTEKGIIQLEFQTDFESLKILDVLDYRVRARRLHDLPVLSVMIYLTKENYPGPGHNCLRESPFGHFQHYFEFLEVRLWEMDPEPILRSGAVGLIPLIPLMRGKGKAPLTRAVAAASAVPDNTLRAEIVTAIAVLGSLKYPADLIKRLIRRETMKESAIFREIFEEGIEEGRSKGIEEGREEGIVTFIVRTLEKRFSSVPDKLKTQIASVRSFERLEELAERAVKCRDFRSFAKSLR